MRAKLNAANMDITIETTTTSTVTITVTNAALVVGQVLYLFNNSTTQTLTLNGQTVANNTIGMFIYTGALKGWIMVGTPAVA